MNKHGIIIRKTFTSPKFFLQYIRYLFYNIFLLNLLQVFFIVSGVIIFLLAIDIARKEKFNALHFVVFICIGLGLLAFTFFPSVLDGIGRLFWIQRGADVLVYSSIVFLLYFSLLLLSKVESWRDDITKLIREIALQNSEKRELWWKFVFVIPAYNEGKVIVNTIQWVLDAGYKNIVVVNDGSSDNTQDALRFFGDKIVAIHHYKNRGQWAALETGFEYIRRYTKSEYVICFDSDGQHDIEDVKVFEQHLDPSVEVLLGSRFLWDGDGEVPFLKRIVLSLGIVFTFFVSQISLSDTHNGFRILSRKALEDIRIEIDGMWHASEIVDIIAKKKIPYKEVPVTIHYTEYSMAKGQKSSNAINIILKVLWNKFFK